MSVAASRQRDMCVIPEAVNTVQMLLTISKNITRNMQSSQGILNYPTQLHLVRHFRILYDDAWKNEYQIWSNFSMSDISKYTIGLNSYYKNECHCLTACLRLDGRPCISATFPFLSNQPCSILSRVQKNHRQQYFVFVNILQASYVKTHFNIIDFKLYLSNACLMQMRCPFLCLFPQYYNSVSFRNTKLANH